MNDTKDAEELKKIRLAQLQEQLQKQYEQQMQEEAAMQEQINALEQMVKSRLTKKALLRYGNIKTAHPQKAVQLLIVLGQLLQSGRINTVTDEQLKDILLKLKPPKHDFKIKRK
jgi:DNA-binding TFAR19-related protein (PDSD5 family)